MPERFMRGIEAENGIVWGPVGWGCSSALAAADDLLGLPAAAVGLLDAAYLGAILTDRTSPPILPARNRPSASVPELSSTALASTIGTGNLVGSGHRHPFPAGRVRCSGCGSWRCWHDDQLRRERAGIYYRRKDPAGGWRGGPM